jgi:hypothetical protein
MADRFVLETSKGSIGNLGHRRLQQWKCSGKLEEALQLLAHHLLHETPQVESGRGVRGSDLQKREKELLRRAHPPQQEHQDRATAADIEPSSRCLRSRRPACRVPAWGRGSCRKARRETSGSLATKPTTRTRWMKGSPPRRHRADWPPNRADVSAGPRIGAAAPLEQAMESGVAICLNAQLPQTR